MFRGTGLDSFFQPRRDPFFLFALYAKSKIELGTDHLIFWGGGGGGGGGAWVIYGETVFFFSSARKADYFFSAG